VNKVESKLGDPSILVNNATYSTGSSVLDLNAEILDQHYKVNIRGTSLLSVEFARRFKRKSGGRIINLTSGQSLGPMVGEIAYATTKGAIDAFTVTLSSEVSSKGITVNAVNPGPTNTGWMTEEIQEYLLPLFPMGRIGMPSDAARIVCFLASDEAKEMRTLFIYRIDPNTYLRILELRDAEQVFKLVDKDRENLAKYLPWVTSSKAMTDTEAFISAELGRYAKNNGFTSGIFYKDEFVGCIGIHDVNWSNKKTSIGYWLGSEFQGNGIMSLSCKGIVTYCFEHLQLNRVEIRARVDNIKSRAIPERLGFKNEGTIRQDEYNNGEFFDHVVYGMIASEWKP